MSKCRIHLPKHIIPRWRKFLNCEGGDIYNNVTPGRKFVKSNPYYYSITAALKAVNIDKEEFLKCWNFVKSRTMPDEVFSWFKDAGFGQIHSTSASTSSRAAFVRKILQRYKDIKVCACIFTFHV